METLQKRPLSPHLQIYRMPLTAGLMSISHRMTGILLAIGTLLLVYWLMAIAGGAESYATAQGILGSWVGLLLMFGWTAAFYYHFCNGIRHLFWDAGYGLDLKNAAWSGQLVLISTAVLTVLTWMLALIL